MRARTVERHRLVATVVAEVRRESCFRLGGLCLTLTVLTGCGGLGSAPPLGGGFFPGGSVPRYWEIVNLGTVTLDVPYAGTWPLIVEYDPDQNVLSGIQPSSKEEFDSIVEARKHFCITHIAAGYGLAVRNYLGSGDVRNVRFTEQGAHYDLSLRRAALLETSDKIIGAIRFGPLPRHAIAPLWSGDHGGEQLSVWGEPIRIRRTGERSGRVELDYLVVRTRTIDESTLPASARVSPKVMRFLNRRGK